MCRYYKHVYSCSHVRYVFTSLCREGTYTQRPCGVRQVWQQLDMEYACPGCLTG
ncbi:hypothetical protein BJ508DRAFT_200630, partial [Ascobolus immersus RN42]